MVRRERMMEAAGQLRALVGPGSIYNGAATRTLMGQVTIGLRRDGEEYELTVKRQPNVLDAIDLGMLAEAFGVADGSEPTITRKTGLVVSTWRWREALPAGTVQAA
jgi:hypothetical protein